MKSLKWALLIVVAMVVSLSATVVADMVWGNPGPFVIPLSLVLSLIVGIVGEKYIGF